MNACKLVHLDFNAPIAITTDSSNFAMGGVLEQYSQNKWQPLGFWSKHLKQDKAKWTTF